MRNVAALMAVGVLFTGCSRYELVPDYLSPECASQGPPPARTGPPVGLNSLGEAGLPVVRGVVRDDDSGSGVHQTTITLHGDSVTRTYSDSEGRFELGAVRPGSYAITARRLGFHTTRDSITVPARQRVELEIRLLHLPYDGPCSGFGRVQVRKPWWKLW